MQKINTENIYKYLQPEKSGGFKKSFLFVKNQGDFQNPCVSTKTRRIYRILAIL
jgi:hypothetical protein